MKQQPSAVIEGPNMDFRHSAKTADLRQRIDEFMDRHVFQVEHVYREQNREADALANQALDETEAKTSSAASAKKTESPSSKPAPPSHKPEAPSSKPEPRKIQARFRGGVLYLLEDVELPDGMVVDVSIHLRPKPV